MLAGGVLPAQMLDPAMDREDEPFCYFAAPTDVIGVKDGQEATLVTPEGFLYTGSAELVFFTGNPPVPVNQRVKTLEHHAPILRYGFVRDGVRYDISVFAATLDGNPLVLPTGARSVEITWRKKASTPEMSYAKAVSEYKKEYRRRYETFLRSGK